MRKHSTATVAALTILLAACTHLSSNVARAQPPVKTSPLQQTATDSAAAPLKTAMQWKLEYSKQILEGLALEDYDKITKNSQALSLLSLESGWKIIQTEEYVKQSSEFRRTANLITDASRDNNLERAALGYVALTVRCIECHGYLRAKHPGHGSSGADNEPPAPDSQTE